MKMLLIGDEKGRRAQHFIKAMENLNITYDFLSWQKFLFNREKIGNFIEKDTIIRIEPPEKDLEVYREFLKLGSQEKKHDEINKIGFSDFKVISPSSWYKGFSKTLEKLSANNNLSFMNHPEDILVMMDKKKTYEKLKEFLERKGGNYSLPKVINDITCYDDIKKNYSSKGLKVFIKLRYGSGGIGVIAYEYNSILKKERAYTTLKMVGENFYNTYKISKYTGENMIKLLVDWVIKEGAHIEYWIRKPKLQDKRFDVRGIFINGKLEYSLARLSKLPITNLHLKNERIPGEDIFSHLQKERLNLALVDVMKSFPKTFYSGTDIILTENNQYIIDVNPFGDLMHHLLESPENLYVKELRELKKIYK